VVRSIPITVLLVKVRPSAALAVAPVVTIDRNDLAADESRNEQPSQRKSFAVVRVIADVTSRKSEMQWRFEIEHPAALTVIVAAAAPHVNVGREAPCPSPTTETRAFAIARFVAVTASACPGATRIRSSDSEAFSAAASVE
jgi:hypothetical protein